MARTSSAYRVGGRLDPFPKAAGDPLFDGQKSHNVNELVDLQLW
jgi:hypothetical protein